MEGTFKYIICLIIILISTGSLSAKDKHIVTVLPFSLNSSENIEYVRQGIQDMLITRITFDNINVLSSDVVSDEMKKSNIKNISLNDVYNIGKKLKSDYVISGSITKIGSSISVDGKLIDISSAKSDVSFFTQSCNLDEVVPKINDFSQRIVQHIIGTSAPAKTAVVTPPPTTSTASSLAPGISRESLIISGMKSSKRRTLTSVINTDFINAPDDPFNLKGFWMSQQFATEFKGMDIGDVNGDGKNEVVTIDNHNVYIYQKTSTEFKLLQVIKGKPYDKYLSVDIADIKRSGGNQIYVTSVNDNILNSFVLEYKDGKYEKIASDLKLFLRVIDTPSGIPLLLCQAYGLGQIFDTPIHEMVWRNGKFIEDQEMKIHRGLSIYGLAIDNLGTGGSDYKVIALDSLDHICIFRQTNKHLSRAFTFGFKNDDLIWRGDEEFGGSNNYIENVTDKKNYERDSNVKTAFVNLRILTYDLNKSGKKQLIIVKNLSPTGRLLKNLKLFTSSEIYNLEWDGLGMSEKWKTKKINGYVSDYVFKDFDNDGKPDLVLALVLSVGSSIRDKSVIVVYKLDDVNHAAGNAQ
jgi:TolB-like protein